MKTKIKKLIEQLRDRAYSFKAPDPLSEQAADEIERLQLTREEAAAEIERLRLTRGERRALEFAVGVYPLDDSIPDTLRGLLERTKGVNNVF